jgi:hypothetical protein
MKISRYTIYLELQPNALLVWQKFYYLQKVGVTPRFIGLFKITEKRGEVPYQLELPPQLSDLHDMFHVYQLKKCFRVPEEQIPM